MVSSIGSQVESAIFQRVIGSLGCDTDFGGDIDVNEADEDCVRGEFDGVGDVENNLSGPEHTEEGADTESAAED